MLVPFFPFFFKTENDQINLNWRVKVSKAGICFEEKWKLEDPIREVGGGAAGGSLLLFGEDGEPLHSTLMEGSHHSASD